MARDPDGHHAPLSVPRLRRLLSGNDLARTVIYQPETGSTNDDALAVARDSSTAGILFLTDFQTQGRGTRGRSWQSPRNQSLLLSTILRPRRMLKSAELTQISALGLCQGLRDSTGLDVKIKWPNDAMVRDRKIGGVLVEVVPGRPAAAVIGIGANLNAAANDIDVADARVTSVLDETGLRCDRESVIAAVIGALEHGYRTVEAGRSLSAEWAELSAVIGRRVALRSETAFIVGVATGFGGDGELILDCEDGVVRRFKAGRLEIEPDSL